MLLFCQGIRIPERNPRSNLILVALRFSRNSSPDLADAVVGASVDHLNLVDHPCFRTDQEVEWEESSLSRELEREGMEGIWAGG